MKISVIILAKALPCKISLR